MATNFPTSIDSPVDPTGNQPLNNPSHSSQHQFENDAIVAIENYLGVSGSAVSTTITYKLNHLTLGSSLTDISITSPAAGQVLQYNGTSWTNQSGFKWGGTGADGVLNISSGTTTINLGNAAVFVKNYSSISITGSAVLNFSNPNTNGTIIIFRCQGNCVITSSGSPAIDLTSMGGAGGTVGSRNGNGGAGAGALLIECSGALNFTGTINANGVNGANGSGTQASFGGGGGGGGTVWIIANTITTNTGTINVGVGTVGNNSSGTIASVIGTAGVSSYSATEFMVLAGGNPGSGGTNNTDTTYVKTGVITSNVLLTRRIPLYPGSGGGAGSSNGSSGASGSIGTGIGGSGNGFSAVIQNTMFS
jgi:hypothetical protein